MNDWLSGLSLVEIWHWISFVLFAVGMTGLMVGLLSFLSPRRSIELYQKIMEFFNWRVEPINFDRELSITKWLGFIMSLLSFAIAAILLCRKS